MLCVTAIESLANAEPSFDEVFREHAAVMLLIDPTQGMIRDANRAAARFYGYPLDRLRGMSIRDINALLPEQVDAEIRRATAAHRSHFVFRHRLASGEVRKVAVWSTPFAFGEDSLLLSIVADLTISGDANDPFWHYQSGLEQQVDLQSSQIADYVRRIRAQDRRTILALLIGVLLLLALTVRLATDVRRRRRAEAEAQQLAKRDRRSASTLARFTEVAAHHLQEPCRRMLSYTELIRRQFDQGAGRPAVERMLKTLEAQALRQRSLVRDIQLYLAASQATGKKGVDDAAALIQDLGTNISAADGARLDVQVAELPPIPLDASWLSYCLRQILQNAIEHAAPDRPLQVRIWSRRHQRRLELLVADNGQGIPPRYRTRVFGIFEQLASPKAASQTGIGLSIVQRIMEAVGGSARAEQTPGGGTTIVLSFSEEGNDL